MGTECQCCCVETDDIQRCARGHAVCTACKRKMGRADCLYCSPCVKEEDGGGATNVRVARGAEPTCVAQCGECVVALLRWAFYLFGTVYVGKVCVWLYVITQDREVSWLEWDHFHHIFRELFIGALGLLVLAGCCIRR